MLLLDDARYDIRVFCKNIHSMIHAEVSVGLASPRTIATLDGCEPLGWLAARKRALGLPETDFEHLTLSDRNGVNAHLSVVEGKLVSGRDLRGRMQLRSVLPQQVHAQVRDFYDDPHAIVFGCAGLKGILTAPLDTKGLGLFLFGEVCTINAVAEFGNLMLSKLRVTLRE